MDLEQTIKVRSLIYLGAIRAQIPTDESYVLQGMAYGYGLLIIANITDGINSVYNINAFNAEMISNTDCGATVTKNGEYTLVIKRPSACTTSFLFMPSKI